MNHCDGGHETGEEVRLLPFANGNLIVCEEHYKRERTEREKQGYYNTPEWKTLKVYNPE